MKPIVLVFTGYYLPAFRAGGPVRTVANIVDRLGDEIDFRIVTRDRDLGEAAPFEGIQRDTWVACGKAQVMYVDPDHFGLRKVAEILRSTPYDVIYLNSFFDPRFTQLVLLNRRIGRVRKAPIIIAPRGEFSESALRLGSIKKKVYIWIAKMTGIYKGLIWQASAAHEANDIARIMGSALCPIKTTGHLTAHSDVPRDFSGSNVVPRRSARSASSDTLLVCFFSRISPMKNLDFALRVLAKVRIPIRFIIYGPIEDENYWRECESLAAKLPPNIIVDYQGALEPDEVVETLSECNLFFLPTRGENFGHAIHEALRAGLPVLISDRTPWGNLEEQGAGWALPLGGADEFARRIESVAQWSDDEGRLWSERAMALAARVGNDASVLEANRALFLDAINAAS